MFCHGFPWEESGGGKQRWWQSVVILLGLILVQCFNALLMLSEWCHFVANFSCTDSYMKFYLCIAPEILKWQSVFLCNLGRLNDFIGQKCLKLKLRSAFALWHEAFKKSFCHINISNWNGVLKLLRHLYLMKLKKFLKKIL